LFGTLPKNALLTGKIRKWPIDRELVHEIRPDLKQAGSEGTSVAYIPQHDLFYENLTLQEHLNFQVMNLKSLPE
jgi:ABC-type multidrug transport system ATPase subunit